MLTVTVRPYSEEEKQQLRARLSTRYQRLESFLTSFFFTAFLLILPFLLLTNYLPVSSVTMMIYCAVAVASSLGLVLWIEHKSHGNRAKELRAIATGQAQVFHVCTSRAIERDDPEDFGTAFYLEIHANRVPQLLYLQGQYLDELEEETFPNTEFEVTRRLDTHEFMDIQLLGHFFKAERTLPAFSMEQWRMGHTPEDGCVLAERLEDLM